MLFEVWNMAKNKNKRNGMISNLLTNHRWSRSGLATGRMSSTSQEDITLHRREGGVAITTLSSLVKDCMTVNSWGNQYTHQEKHIMKTNVY